MRIACLQFNPELGRLPENIARANALLQVASPRNIDLLVLPELAFTGTASSTRPCSSCPPIFSPLTPRKATTTPPSPPYCHTSNRPPLVHPPPGRKKPHPVSIVSSQSATPSFAPHLPLLAQRLKISRLLGKSQPTIPPSLSHP